MVSNDPSLALSFSLLSHRRAPKVDDFDEDEMNFYTANSNRPPRPNNDPYNPYGQGAGNANFRNNNPNRVRCLPRPVV